MNFVSFSLAGWLLIGLVFAEEFKPYEQLGDYFQYANVPAEHEYEFGFSRGNPSHKISRHEQAKAGHFRTKVKWQDAYEGQGEHYWEYNHGDHKGDYKPEYKPEYKPQQKPEYKPEYKPQYKPQYKPEYKPEYKEEIHSGYKSKYEPSYETTAGYGSPSYDPYKEVPVYKPSTYRTTAYDTIFRNP